MATVSNTLRLRDSMGGVLRGILADMDRTIGSMERLDAASERLDLGRGMAGAESAAAGLQGRYATMERDIHRNAQKQRDFNRQIQDGMTAAGSLRSTLAGIGAVIGIKKLAAVSDQTTLIKTRLGLINDGLQTNEDLQEKIYAAAGRSRGLYTDMAASVSKLGLLAGSAFANNDEIIRFTETFQKAGIVGGSSASEMSNAMYQLNQAMASGRLQGDEYRSIIENAPMLAKAIEEYMVKVKGAKGAMKDWSSEGLLTADVIKNAMFSVADEVDAKFREMPMTWGQVWNGVVNQLLRVGDKLLTFVNFLANHWSLIEPIVVAAAAVLAAYLSALLLYNGAAAAAAIATGVHTAFTTGWTAATFIATEAQTGLNAALLACPITWIIAGILLLIALFYAGVAAVNKFAGTSLSATGLIMGSLYVAAAFIDNLFRGLFIFLLTCIGQIYNVFATFASFLNNVFVDPVASIIYLFADLADSVLQILQSIAKGIDLVFGSHIADTYAGWRENVASWADTAAAKYGNGKYQKIERWDTEDVLKELKISTERKSYADAWKQGNAFGSSLVAGSGGGLDLEGLLGAAAEETYDVNVKDDVNLADESLAYLLDAVTQKYINRVNVTAPAPTVNVQFGDVHRDVDLDALAEQTKRKIGTELVEYAMSSTDLKR